MRRTMQNTQNTVHSIQCDVPPQQDGAALERPGEAVLKVKRSSQHSKYEGVAEQEGGGVAGKAGGELGEVGQAGHAAHQ